jgi:hypothetical protein
MHPFFEYVSEDIRKQIALLPRDHEGLFIVPMENHYLSDHCCILSAYLRLFDLNGYGQVASGVCSVTDAGLCAYGTPYKLSQALFYEACTPQQQSIIDKAWDIAHAFDECPLEFDIHEALGITQE